MNKRITKKVNQKFYQGCLNAVFAYAPTKELTERFWLMIEMCKKLHWIKKDHYYANTKMQAFAMSIWNKHTTKRDVYKYVKTIKANSKFAYMIYKPDHGNLKTPNTWDVLKMKNSYIRFTNRWFHQLNYGMQFLLHWTNFYSTVKDFKHFLDQVANKIRQVKKDEKQAAK